MRRGRINSRLGGFRYVDLSESNKNISPTKKAEIGQSFYTDEKMNWSNPFLFGSRNEKDIVERANKLKNSGEKNITIVKYEDKDYKVFNRG